ncbi:MAG: DUF4019 domain-containing protein [Burkholderiaceae bacterium]|nr:MAG: DUF4019 domain-containing protein [Burkholderiaceae bacterium]
MSLVPSVRTGAHAPVGPRSDPPSPSRPPPRLNEMTSDRSPCPRLALSPRPEADPLCRPGRRAALRRGLLLMVGGGLGGALLGGCMPSEKVLTRIDPEVDQFHARVQAGEDEAIWDDLDPSMQRLHPQAEWFDLLARIRDRLGEAQGKERVAHSIVERDGGQYVAASYKTRFAQGEAVEEFAFFVKGQLIRISRYNVHSSRLMAG